MKLIALYAHPKNTEEFDKAYFKTHVPLIKQVPGLQDIKISKHSRTYVGVNAPYLITEMTFADKESLISGLNSEEMGAAGENLDTFAEGRYTLMMAEEA